MSKMQPNGMRTILKTCLRNQNDICFNYFLSLINQTSFENFKQNILN